ncbi:MAG: hypothetical protein KBT75_13100 [Oleispira antarctica]|uniref:Uncharacterized protein n=1 Tax=Oleispira antarctica RB-8 TaxID=698738 RepID=R4YKM1_OLEAN|nr:hypothetical protein [Oleispira antarctica]MBQ0791702.1 hypothetical protein [Oleispira antarctica]CCK75131.1 hypothetical protein OLEAN_C09550 [Oleispira antarctica RB-8]
MKNNKVLLLILTITFSPFLIAAILTTDYFSQQIDQKQYGEFLTTEFYLPRSDSSLLDSSTQWQLVISPSHKNYDILSNKLNKIKTALGKRSELVNILSTPSIDSKLLASENTVYIATPNGQLLLAYRNEQVGKPLFKDLSHLLRSNN